jgi:hypothetical protein
VKWRKLVGDVAWIPARTAGFAVLAYEGLGLKRRGCQWSAPAAA